MKLLSWNVNGIRAVLPRGFTDWVAYEKADIVCLQETKAQQEQVNLLLPGFEQLWNSAEKKGYSGTAIFTKEAPLNVSYGLGIKKHDREGRVITAEFSGFFLVNVYTPNSKRELERLGYRTQEWDVDFLAYCKGLERRKPVIFCGDLNVAHKEIDLAHPKGNTRNAGFTIEERTSFDNIVAAGFIDTFREFNREGGNYTWWSNFAKSRERNVGWRIDYFCISPSLRPGLREAFIQPQVMGSDHCPVGMVIG